tara:strand:+ start:12324 stop:12578 length:255 start_codon:yes stop_codon:yes gene_type:complete
VAAYDPFHINVIVTDPDPDTLAAALYADAKHQKLLHNQKNGCGNRSNNRHVFRPCCYETREFTGKAYALTGLFGKRCEQDNGFH